MKQKLLVALLLTVAFGYLAMVSGALPSAGAADETLSAQADSAPTAAVSPSPEQSPSPQPAEEPTSSPEQSPSQETAEESTSPPEQNPSQEPVKEPSPAPSPVQVITTTITADSIIDNNTNYTVDENALSAEDLTLTLPSDGPQILIIHTHTTEAYTMDGDDSYVQTDSYRTTDIQHSVVRVGEELKTALEAYGLQVLHDTNFYDYPSYTGSYARSGAAVTAYLAQYPSISLVIDLHRDALGTESTIYKTVTDVQGTTAAQIMFVMGTDENLYHPHWQENLKLALKLQNATAALYPELMRPIELSSYRYNEQLTTGSMLMEVGTSGNTLQEALEAVRLFAKAAGPVLASLVK